MRHELSTLELRILAEELNAVRGYHIDQFYQLGEGRFRIRLSSKDGKINLNMEIPSYIALSSSGEIAEEATGFAIAVRKRVSGARITGISLLNNDRIVRIAFERGGEGGSMIVEMFGQGNLVITDSQMEVLLALQTHEFADRKIRKGGKYTPPKNECVDPRDSKAVAGVFDAVKGAPAGDRLMSFLSKRLGMGSIYLEDAMRKEGLDPKIKVRDVDAKAVEGIRKSIAALAETRGGAILYLKDGKPEAVAVAEIGKYSQLEKRMMPLNEAIEALYTSAPRQQAQGPSEEVQRLEATMEKQREAVERMKKEEAECRRKGEFISANVADLNKVIALATAKREMDELKDAAKGFAIKNIDKAKKTITIDSGDAS